MNRALDHSLYTMLMRVNNEKKDLSLPMALLYVCIALVNN